MNIVYMHTHDTGRYIQPYGYSVPTPRLQAFAEEAILFRQAFNAAPTCSPSRAALLTGMAPHSAGMLGLVHRGFGLRQPERHLAAYLRRNGYLTALSGVQHESSDPQTIGYELILHSGNSKNKTDGSWDEENARRAAEFIRSRESGQPFFLSFGMFSTHRDFPEPDPDINPNYILPPQPLADTKQNREDMAAFMTSARTADRCAGIVLDAIREAGLENNTLIIFTTDHGIAFPRMKCNLYDTGIGVSLIMKVPGLANSKGRVIDALVSQIDLYPTICDLAGIEKPDWLQGVSLVPLLAGETERIRDHLFSEVTYHAAYEPMRCIRTERYKYIKLFDDYDGHVPANIDDSPSKSFLLDSGLLDEKRDREQLYDLYLDPTERVNRVADPAYKAVYEDLAAKLADWMKETSDPLLAGKVPLPPGGKANKRTSLSPRSGEFE
jgi:arylsulfatase A-like enzyme